jgi:hypothetical protein
VVLGGVALALSAPLVCNMRVFLALSHSLRCPGLEYSFTPYGVQGSSTLSFPTMSRVRVLFHSLRCPGLEYSLFPYGVQGLSALSFPMVSEFEYWAWGEQSLAPYAFSGHWVGPVAWSVDGEWVSGVSFEV